MIVTCPDCGDRFNDEHVSTVCPHRGIGYCRGCDCVICVCSPATAKPKSSIYGCGTFPINTWRVPGTKHIVSWYGWRNMIGTYCPFFGKMTPWFIKGPLWNWCWQTNFDWREAMKKSWR